MTAALLLALALFPGAQAADTPEQEPVDVAAGAELVLLSDVRHLAVRVAELRGESFETPPVAVRAPMDMRRVAAQIRVVRSLGSDRLAARGRAWAAIGLGHDESAAQLYRLRAEDLTDMMLDPIQARLLIDPDRLVPRELRIDQQGGEAEEHSAFLHATGVTVDEPLLAHVLVHQLQRQRRGDGLPETSDELLAEAVWQEGEANLVALLLVFRGMGLEQLVIDGDVDPGEILDGSLVPGVGYGSTAEAALSWIYQESFDRVAASYRHGGWDALANEADSRRATAEVIHPGRKPRPPAEVETVRPLVPDDWTQVDTDRVGEWLTAALLGRWGLADSHAQDAADGWAGDALMRWESPDDPTRSLTQWVTRWTSAEHAGEFAQAYLQALRTRYADAEIEPQEGGSWLLETDGSVISVIRKGEETSIHVLSGDFKTEAGS